MITRLTAIPPEYLEQIMEQEGLGKPAAEDIERCKQRWDRQTPEDQAKYKEMYEKQLGITKAGQASESKAGRIR